MYRDESTVSEASLKRPHCESYVFKRQEGGNNSAGHKDI